jgi:hypothetical protein
MGAEGYGKIPLRQALGSGTFHAHSRPAHFAQQTHGARTLGPRGRSSLAPWEMMRLLACARSCRRARNALGPTLQTIGATVGCDDPTSPCWDRATCRGTETTLRSKNRP